MAPIVALIIFIGVYPAPILNRITPTVDRLAHHVALANPPAPHHLTAATHSGENAAARAAANGRAVNGR